MRNSLVVVVAALICGVSGLTAYAQSETDRGLGVRVVQLLEESGYRYTKETPWLWSLPFTATNMSRVSVWVMTNGDEVIIECVIARRDQVTHASEVMRRLLVMNGSHSDLAFLVDEDGNYVARSRWVLEQLDGSLFKSSIQAIIAATDLAYGAVMGFLADESARQPETVTRTVGASASATASVALLMGQASVSFDPSVWKETRTAEAGKRTFRHAWGSGFAMVVAEQINIPIERLRDRVLANMRKTASEVRVIDEESHLVNGTDVVSLQTDVIVQGVPFTYLGYYYGGPAGTIQLVTYAERARFEEYRREFEEFLNGLRVVPVR